MTIPTFTMRQLIESGAHFGHHSRRWNPKMKPYIYGTRDKIHIIDLQQTVPMLYRALQVIHDTASRGGKILFVATKRQAQEPIAEAARRCGQHFINYRWLGGLLTNWSTVSHSINRFKELQKIDAENLGLTKKEALDLQREVQKLSSALSGIVEMGGAPDLLFVIDTVKEKIAIQEARKLGIPIVAICDTNSDISEIDYPIPANDDATRAINLYCALISDTILDGLKEQLVRSGVDLGSQEGSLEQGLLAKDKSSAESSDLSSSAEGEEEEETAKTKAKKALVKKDKKTVEPKTSVVIEKKKTRATKTQEKE